MLPIATGAAGARATQDLRSCRQQFDHGCRFAMVVSSVHFESVVFRCASARPWPNLVEAVNSVHVTQAGAADRHLRHFCL